MPTTNRPTPAHDNVATLHRGNVVACYRGNVVALYHGEVVTWWRGGVPVGAGRGAPRARVPRVRGKLASWQGKLGFWASWQAGGFSGRAGELWRQRKKFF